ncbi:MAG: glycoside hydrolase family 76 protein [Streptosporangiaceae bacterium]
MTDTRQPDYSAYAAAGAAVLQRWYCRLTGRWRTTGWWNAANALTAVIDYTQRTGERSHAWAVHWTFRVARWRHSHFVDRFFDDNGWWALAWIRAYDLTGEARYLDAARRIFDNMVTAWDDTCDGGLWWNQDRKYKNAITNELFLTVAARLQLRSPGRDGNYRDWALRAWHWFGASGMIGHNGLVNDGLTADCQNNGKPTYTYNQGVILGGLADLYEITGENALLRQGESIADAALGELSSPPSAKRPGILAEPGEADMVGRHGDGSQFKGIFVRNLCDFYRHSRRTEYRDYILRNAGSIWENSRNADNQFGLCWAGPFDTADASRQSSGLDALNAAVALSGETR